MNGRLDIGIVSAGRVGAVLGSALRASGHRIVGAYASSEASLDRLDTMLHGVPALSVEEIVKKSELVIFAVPDDELAPLVSGLAALGLFRAGQMIIHVAGRYGVNVLEPAAKAGALTLAIHPAMTFTGTSLDVARLQGCPFAITGPTMYLPIGQALVAEIGGESFVVAEENRSTYHAALAHASNHLVTLIAQAERMLEASGIAEGGAYLGPLVHAALDGTLRNGEAALTGPVARGDVGTVREHLESIEALAATGDFEDLPRTYRALASATAMRAQERALHNDPKMAEILAVLAD